MSLATAAFVPCRIFEKTWASGAAALSENGLLRRGSQISADEGLGLGHSGDDGGQMMSFARLFDDERATYMLETPPLD
jgi:hypothetical protein